LIALAKQYVDAAEQLAAIRSEMVRLLANGVGGGEEADRHPTLARPKPGRASKPKAHPGKHAEMRAASAALDRTTLDLIRAQPGLKTGEIRKALAMKSTTATERMKRLRARGLIEPSGDGWQVAET
jgi:hypothetical protein